MENHRFPSFPMREEKLSTVLRVILACLHPAGKQRVRMALIAPYYLLKRDGIKSEDFPPDPSLEGIRQSET